MPYYPPRLTSWQNLSVNAPWQNAGGVYAVASYAIRGFEVVFRGMLTTTAPGTVIMVLPIGVRPATVKVLPCVGFNNSFGWGTSGLYIGADGVCLATHGYTDLFSLDGIAFFLGS